MAQYELKSEENKVAWAIGGIVFAAILMVLVGTFQAIAGLTAIVDDKFFVATPNYTFAFDATTWGWIHLILGSFVVVAGFALFAGRAWAAVTALVLAALSAIANFFFIPVYPVWAIVTIALACWVMWALTRPGVLRD